MPRKKTRVPKSGPVWRKSAEEATLDRMPKFNAHACGTGPHGDAKYNRARQKSAWQKEIAQEGARTRGCLPFSSNACRRGRAIPVARIRNVLRQALINLASTALFSVYLGPQLHEVGGAGGGAQHAVDV